MYGNHAFFMWMLNVLLLLQAAHICESHQGDPIPRACVPPHDMYPFCNTSLPLDERLDDLISRLTLEEKPYLLVARESPKGNISRLGIPEYDWGGNCMHGVQSKCAPDGRCPTSFPNPNNLGASFNETLWKAMGSVIGIELRALWLQNVGEKTTSNLPHIGLDCWSPNIDIQRDPRWGRNMETPSEDPFVCGRYGVAYTLGLQNNSLDDRYLQAVATLKHFDANSLEGYWNADGTWGKNAPISRHSVNATISMYDLYSSYLPSFKAAVVEGGAAGIMCR
jgi:beta-glucosidase-like glycosyl hydrolase